MDHEASQGDANSSYHHYMERAYKYRPVKVIDFDSPRQHCIVYLDLKREEWPNHFPSGMQEKGSAAFTVGYEFASRTKPLEESCKGNYTFTGGKAVGYRNLFGMSLTVFVEEDGPIFINGVLHLRAELTVKQ